MRILCILVLVVISIIEVGPSPITPDSVNLGRVVLAGMVL